MEVVYGNRLQEDQNPNEENVTPLRTTRSGRPVVTPGWRLSSSERFFYKSECSDFKDNSFKYYNDLMVILSCLTQSNVARFVLVTQYFQFFYQTIISTLQTFQSSRTQLLVMFLSQLYF